MLIPKEKPLITVVGDVGGRIAIIVDDIIDDVDSFLAAAETLKERGVAEHERTPSLDHVPVVAHLLTRIAERVAGLCRQGSVSDSS